MDYAMCISPPLDWAVWELWKEKYLTNLDWGQTLPSAFIGTAQTRYLFVGAR